MHKLFTSLSFSHLAELIAISAPLKRAFYEFDPMAVPVVELRPLRGRPQNAVQDHP